MDPVSPPRVVGSGPELELPSAEESRSSFRAGNFRWLICALLLFGMTKITWIVRSSGYSNPLFKGIWAEMKLITAIPFLLFRLPMRPAWWRSAG